MQQYSLFTHGTALEVETPANLAHFVRLGWGTEITFKKPVVEDFHGLPVTNAEGPGSWFHLPLTSTLTTFGRRNPQLESVTLLFETSHCRIVHLHVWDGAKLVQEFNGIHRKGAFLATRDTDDVDPESLQSSPQRFSNTFTLSRPHRVFSAIGLSFFACAFHEDFNVGGFSPPLGAPLPPAVLIVAAGGGQFVVADMPLLQLSLGKVRISLDP
jgi:hypothetical protein